MPTAAPGFSQLITRLKSAVNQTLLGKEKVVELTVVALIAGGHLLLEDLPGVGKTTLAAGLAHSVAGVFSRIQFTADLLPSDIIGTQIYKRAEDRFEFVKGPVFSNFVLADELNRAPPKTQSALLQVMSEGFVSFSGVDMPMAKPFMVIGTQNPRGHHGTYPLPESQRDRFTMRLVIGPPDHDAELKILEEGRTPGFSNMMEPVATPEAVIEMTAAAGKIPVPPPTADYIIRLAAETRRHPDVVIPVSPRGSLALFNAARALAFVRGKSLVDIDLVKELAPCVLSHRISLKTGYFSSGEGVEENWIKQELLDRVEID